MLHASRALGEETVTDSALTERFVSLARPKGWNWLCACAGDPYPTFLSVLDLNQFAQVGVLEFGLAEAVFILGASPPCLHLCFSVLYRIEFTTSVANMALTEDPSTSRFQHHVSFDNFAGGEGTAKNSLSFTLNVKHRGYQRKRRSRTFMVGVDENDYSDIALSWMLEELVDDGDEVICLRVVDKDAKVVNDRSVDKKQYQEEAKKLMERIVSRNDENRAISIVLEFAVGKVHAVFQKMV